MQGRVGHAGAVQCSAVQAKCTTRYSALQHIQCSTKALDTKALDTKALDTKALDTQGAKGCSALLEG